jgi:hypothetical protein
MSGRSGNRGFSTAHQRAGFERPIRTLRAPSHLERAFGGRDLLSRPCPGFERRASFP